MGYFLAFGLSLVCAFFSSWFSFEWTSETEQAWTFSFFLAVALSVCIVEPILVSRAKRGPAGGRRCVLDFSSADCMTE